MSWSFARVKLLLIMALLRSAYRAYQRELIPVERRLLSTKDVET
jgi:hypothetical protein